MKSRLRARNALTVLGFLSVLARFEPLTLVAATNPPAAEYRWTMNLPAAIAGSPALSADSSTLYVGAGNRRFYALDTESGETNWVVKLPATISSSPVIDDDGFIYVGCSDGRLYRISDEGDFGTNDLRSAPLARPLSTAAVSDDGTIYVGTTGNLLYSLVPEDLAVNWFYIAPNDVRSPVINEDGTILIVAGGFLRGVSESGSQESSLSPGSAIQSLPAVGENGTIYFGANDERVYAVGSGGTTNDIDWRFNTGRNVMSSPAVGADGRIYIASENSRLYSLTTNGAVRWSRGTPGRIRSALSIGADGTVYAGADDRRLYAFSPDDGHIVWAAKTRAAVRSSAVIDDQGTVYFTSGRTVYAVIGTSVDAGEPAWQMFRKDRRHTARATLVIEPTTAPLISRQPTNQAVDLGSNATFVVVASSASPLSYQWYFNSNAISSAINPTATNATLAITNVTGTNAGFYFVVVTNAFGAVTSSVAQLFAGEALAIVQQPVNQTAITNTTVSFTVVVTGLQPFSYQWRNNTQPIPVALNATATNATLTLPSITPAAQGYYDVVIVNGSGSITSAPALLLVTTNVVIVTNAVVITHQPMDLTVAEGTSAVFSLIATGTPPPSFQWYYSTNPISSVVNPTAVTSNLVLSGVQGSNAGFYFVVAMNAAGSVTSSIASLTVTNETTVWLPTQTNGVGITISNSAPFILRQPTNQALVPIGSDVPFTVSAEGAKPLFYQWYVGVNAIESSNNPTATNATFVLSNVQSASVVQVIVSNSLGRVTSSNAFLSIAPTFPGLTGKSLVSSGNGIRLGPVFQSERSVTVKVSSVADRKKLVLEYKDNLSDPEWKPLSTNDSTSLKLIDPVPPLERSRFYRVRAE